MDLRRTVREVVHRTVERSGRQFSRPLSPLLDEAARLIVSLDHLVALRVLEDPDLFFVQIGAFDGRSDDQIHEYVVRFGWHGVLVEPQRQHFEALRETYRDRPGLRLENVAVSDRPETRPFYTVRQMPGLPAIAQQAASFDRAHLERHLPEWARAAIVEEPVQCATLADLLAGVERVDLLQVDVEGFDAEIIRMFDFERFSPAIVRFEHRHLSRLDHERAVARLVSHGYRVATNNYDTLAWTDWRR